MSKDCNARQLLQSKQKWGKHFKHLCVCFQTSLKSISLNSQVYFRMYAKGMYLCEPFTSNSIVRHSR